MESLREYIRERSIPVPFVGCWMWLLSCGSHGYGNATSPWKRVDSAHRVSFLAFKGAIPAGMLVQHGCDNKWCVNPDHLSLGTDATNAKDKQFKGRSAHHRLTDESVSSIKEEIAAGTPLRAIARAMGVSQRLIQKIAQQEFWQHIG